MTAHRAALPVKTEINSVGPQLLLCAGQPAGLRYTSQMRPPLSALDELAATHQPSAACTQPSAACALRPRPESVKTARDFTGIVLREWGLSHLADIAGLVVSELVTNALRHGVTPGQAGRGDCPVRLRLLGQAPYVMCLVTDPGSGSPVLREPDPFGETGRGLNVVESCCVRWGWYLLDGGGKVVWALLHPDA
jgi:anti-sigma regulatory factor (Ser/Thr protein kinase)